MGRRRHVKADDVLKLGNEVRIVRALEGSETMGLQLVSLPDPLHRAQRDTHRLLRSLDFQLGERLLETLLRSELVDETGTGDHQRQ